MTHWCTCRLKASRVNAPIFSRLICYCIRNNTPYIYSRKSCNWHYAWKTYTIIKHSVESSLWDENLDICRTRGNNNDGDIMIITKSKADFTLIFMKRSDMDLVRLFWIINTKTAFYILKKNHKVVKCFQLHGHFLSRKKIQYSVFFFM